MCCKLRFSRMAGLNIGLFATVTDATSPSNMQLFVEQKFFHFQTPHVAAPIMSPSN